MDARNERCAASNRIQRIDDAFRRGDLDALRAAVEDPSAIPNGAMPLAIGPCLEYAIYHSPLSFVRRLLELGADPNPPDHPAFPPLIAALSCSRPAPGAPARSDVPELLELLLDAGADPDQRGMNDYTALHMAVASRSLDSVRLLLDHGADARLRTRIDECETPRELALSLGFLEVVAPLADAEAGRDP